MPSTHIIRKQPLIFAGLLMLANLVFAMPVNALSIDKMAPNSGLISGGNKISIRVSGFMTTVPEVFDDVAAGVNHALLLSENGHVWSVGSNKYGQLGTGKLSTIDASKPVDITDSFNLTDGDYIYRVVAGDYCSFAVSINGRVYAWGRGDYGRLGNGSNVNQPKPVEITDNFALEDDDRIENIQAGPDYGFAISAEGRAFGFGDAAEYRMPHNEKKYAYYSVPTEITDYVDGDKSMRALTTGNRISMAMLTGHDKELMTWGCNDKGQLGRSAPGQKNDSSDSTQAYPIINNIALADGDEIESIEAGNDAMAVLSKYGQVYVWGSNQMGLLGIGGANPNPNDGETGVEFSSAPINITKQFKLSDSDQISKISLGNSHALALSVSGQVFVWGMDDLGQAGDGVDGVTGSRINAPLDITAQFKLPAGAKIKTVLAAGKSDNVTASYSYAIDTNGKVYRWGNKTLDKLNPKIIAWQSSPRIISGSLVARLPNIDMIRFGDQEVNDFDVVDDGTIVLTVPAGLSSGEAEVEAMDSAGNIVSAGMYNYTEIPIVDDQGDDGDDPNNDNNGNSNIDETTQHANTDDKNNDQAGATNLVKDGLDNNKSSSNLGNLPSTSNKFRIAAPNTSAEL